MTFNRFPSAVTFRPVEDPSSVGRRLLMGYPQALFRGEGLWIWGATPRTLIHDIKTGTQSCFSLSTVAIPGLFFEAGMSFEEFQQLLEKSPEAWTHERLRELPPIRGHQHIRMLTAEIGNTVSLDVEGPITHAVAWGTTVL